MNEINNIEPRNDFEIKILKIWSEILDISFEKISIRTNFFSLGGHSITAIQLVSRINNEFKSNIQVRNIFQLKTIENICTLWNTDYSHLLLRIG